MYIFIYSIRPSFIEISLHASLNLNSTTAQYRSQCFSHKNLGVRAGAKISGILSILKDHKLKCIHIIGETG